MKEILISSKKELDIYMDPQRQRLLKCMELQGQSQTAKQLSLLLGIYPSSVSFHLKKLESLGLVELERTEMFHGICARYYRPVPALVQLRANDASPLKDDKELLLEYMPQDSWAGYKEYIKSADDQPDELKGDISNGVLYLDEAAVKELKAFFSSFQQRHSKPRQGAEAWDVSLLAYPRTKL